MQIFKEKAALEAAVRKVKSDELSIGFVPTMGALHEGHISLVTRATAVCDFIVVSIFINPTQFNNTEDLESYPRTLEKDLAKLQALKIKNLLVFVPSASELYGNEIKSCEFNFEGLETKMEGKYRAGHFNGVGTVVKRLFELVKPNKAFFGEKDFQQLQIIRKMVKKEGLTVQIVGCPIHRENNGLARSSRNERLTHQTREKASFIYQTLQKVKDKFGTESVKSISEWVKNEFEKNEFFKLEYFEIADTETLESSENTNKNTPYRAFIAVYADDVRLIDNIALN